MGEIRFIKECSLQGRIVRIGGDRDTVSVVIQDAAGCVYLCRAPRGRASLLSRHMAVPVRVYGSGRWTRSEEGAWRADHFQISDYEVLEDTSFADVVSEIRARCWG